MRIRGQISALVVLLFLLVMNDFYDVWAQSPPLPQETPYDITPLPRYPIQMSLMAWLGLGSLLVLVALATAGRNLALKHKNEDSELATLRYIHEQIETLNHSATQTEEKLTRVGSILRNFLSQRFDSDLRSASSAELRALQNKDPHILPIIEELLQMEHLRYGGTDDAVSSFGFKKLLSELERYQSHLQSAAVQKNSDARQNERSSEQV